MATSSIPLRTNGVVDQVAEAIRIFARNWWVVLALSLWPTALLEAIDRFTGTKFWDSPAGVATAVVLALGIGLYSATFLPLAYANLVEQELGESERSIRRALQRAVTRGPALLGTHFVAGIILLILYLLLIIPGVIWSLYYTFYVYVVALRGLSGKEALDYSKSLVEGRWWQIFLHATGLSFVVFLPITILNVVIPEGIFGTIISSLFSDIFALTMAVWFLNLDARGPVRKEKVASSLDEDVGQPSLTS